MAGIDIGGSGEVEVSVFLETILKYYSFQEYMIKKYDLIEKIKPKKENLIFVLGYDKFYKMFNSSKEDIRDESEKVFDTYKELLNMLSISSDKKSGVIVLLATKDDRFL